MDNTKLNELAARAMGWKLFSPPHLNYAKIWATKDGIIQCPVGEWNPAGCADDALALLEKVSEGRWTCVHGTNGIWCFVGPREESEHWSTAVSAPLAMTLCGLRADWVTEEQIQEALK